MKIIHIVILICLSVGLMIVLSFYGDTSRYVSFKEASELNQTNPDKEYHVVCRIDTTKEMVFNPTRDANYFSFYAVDSLGTEMKIVYLNSKPQDLERTDKIVLIGISKGDHFLAKDILKKCPSKYEKKEGPEVANISTQKP